MLLIEIARIALGSLRTNKIRAFLTMLGVVIGVAAVITMMAVGQGAQQAIQDRIASMGLNELSVHGGATRGPGGARTRAPITVDDARALNREMVYAERIVTLSNMRLQVKYRNRNAELETIATTPEYFLTGNVPLVAGRFFTAGEVENSQFVALVTNEALDELDANESIVGEYIRAEGVNLQVVGIVDVSALGGGWRRPPAVFVPLSTAERRLQTVRSVEANVTARSRDEVVATAEEIERILRRERKLLPGAPNNFTIRNRMDVAETFASTARTFGMLLASIAAVSLVVGGIGIMNIMLVSVTERTREIGIRMAIGAPRRTIMLQFLFEAIILCVFGGLLGVGVGALAAHFMATQGNWMVVITPWSVVLAVAFALAVGVFFGLYPAMRAARLDPIDALRRE
jgi:putative ABC transport system permease protein